MISIRTRSVTTIAVAALVLGPLAGCGDDKPSSSGTPEASAPSASASGSTAAASAGKDVPVDAFLSRISSGMADQKSVHMSIGGSSALQLEADVRYGTSPAIRLDTSLAGSKVSMMIVDGSLYIQQPGGRFKKIAKDDKTYGDLLDSFEDFGPRGSVEELKSGISKVVEVGPQTIDGEELTQYDVTVDTTKVAGSLQQLAAGGSEKLVTMKFYLDGEGLLRQISVDGGGTPVTMTFSDWGKPVDLKAPTGSELAGP